MRKLTLTAAALAVLALLAAACGGGDSAVVAADCDLDEVDGDLNLYNWSEYIDEGILDAFSEEYGVEWTHDNYDSNEGRNPPVGATDRP